MADQRKVIIRGYASRKLRDKNNEKPESGELFAEVSTLDEFTRETDRAVAGPIAEWKSLNYFTESGEPLLTCTAVVAYLS